MLKTKRKNSRAGLTLTEVMVVMVVVAVLAAVAIPSMIGFIQHGQQVNRMNVARTLYVAMQGQLTRAVSEGNLRAVLTDGFYVRNPAGRLVFDEDEGYFELILADLGNLGGGRRGTGRVRDWLVGSFPEGSEDYENRNYVFFISKPAGFVRNTGPSANDTPVDKFYDLLDEVIIDKEILDNAILMEFNIRTGVIMSIFYGDDERLWVLPGSRAVNNRHFVYEATANDNINNIFGGRGMSGPGYYQHARRLRQGYFGVTYTGVVPDLPIDDIVRIFDGMDYYLNVGTPAVPDRRTNILYAEFLLVNGLTSADDTATGRRLEIYDDSSGIPLNGFSIDNPFTQRQPNFGAALVYGQATNLNQHALYLDAANPITINQFGINVAGVFSRYIWILDYIEGDTFNQPNNISVNAGAGVFGGGPVDIRARVTSAGGASTESFMFANSHFAADLTGGMFQITSVRHLNNVRYFPDRSFLQTEHIDMSTLAVASPLGPTWNFMPIGLRSDGTSIPFTGVYNAVRGEYSQWRIENLVITIPTGLTATEINVGLFSEIGGIPVGGTVAEEGTVVGVSVYGGRINGQRANNVGAIAGVLHYGTIARSNSFSNVEGRFGNTGGTGNTGGLVGRIDPGGTLAYSFNAGFFNTHPRENMPITASTRTVNGIGSVSVGLEALGGVGGYGNMNIGGLVGSNAGTIRMSFNNARVNIYNVSLTDELRLLSTNPVPIQPITITNQDSTFLGGIAGENLGAGTITNTYATNFVAIYPNGNSGGIVGRNVNPNPNSITRSYFIANGASGVGAISKYELMVMDLRSGTVRFEAYGNFPDDYEEGRNLYIHYPYPILENNRPFAGIQAEYVNPNEDLSRQWGWEDIEDAQPGVRLVYFELYSDGNYGVWPPVNLTGLAGVRPLRDDLPIREAGYMLIATTETNTRPVAATPPNTPDPPIAANLWLYVRSGSIQETVHWDDEHLLPNISFSEAETTLARAEDDFRVWYAKLRLPALEQRLGMTPTARNTPLRFVASSARLTNNHARIHDSGEIHPFFAPNRRGYRPVDDIPAYEIRTPWQMQNIGRVNTGTAATPPGAGGGGVNATPPYPLPDPATYANMGVICIGPDWYQVFYHNNIPIGSHGDRPTVPIGDRINAIRDSAQVGANVQTFSGDRIITDDLVSGADRINLSNGNITLVGDFTGVNIRFTGYGTLTLGTGIAPFVVQNPADEPTFISYEASNHININVSNGTILENVSLASSGGEGIRFSSTPVSGIGNTVRMNALFYSNHTISGTIAAQNWASNLLPQIYSGNEINLTMTGSTYMSGVFYAHGVPRINLPGVTRFDGLVYSRDNAITITPSNANIAVVPTNLPGAGVLDPVVQAFLAAKGWQFPSGGVGTPGDGEWTPGTPHIQFLQTRNISFREPFSNSFGLTTAATNHIGDRGHPVARPGADGTSPVLPMNAIVGGRFSGIYDGQGYRDALGRPVGLGHRISHVELRNAGNTPSGLFAINHGTIRNLALRDSDISVRDPELPARNATAGGIAGQNMGIVEFVAVEHFIGTTAVSGANNRTGGIVGENNGTIRDVYFLATNSPNPAITPLPVSSGGGGIVGTNIGNVTRALYLAPAPRDDDEFNPIVRSGRGVATRRPVDSFFLQGHRHSRDGDVENWVNVDGHYNRPSPLSPHIEHVGGGVGLITRNIDFDEINSIYRAGFSLEHWQQLPGYPYPRLRVLGAPSIWPLTDSPVQPRQLERPTWAIPEINRANSVQFGNNYFGENLIDPRYPHAPWPVLRTAPLPLPPGAGWNVTDGQESHFPSGPRVAGHYNPTPFTNLFFIYYHASWVPMWRVRPNESLPTDTEQIIIDRSQAIEFQRAIGTGANGGVRTNITGETDGVHVELNAEMPGTIYQIAPTVPGTELYYSFFHARRNHGGSPGVAGVQRMYFYLSEMVWDPTGGVDGEGAFVRPLGSDGQPLPSTVIRPAITPRSNTALSSTNSFTRRSVVYGTTANTDAETVTPGRVWFWDPNRHGPGRGGQRYAFLYDVWVAPTTGTGAANAPINSGAPGQNSGVSGIGITFWSYHNLVTIGGTGTGFDPGTGGILQIPLFGVRDIITERTATGETAYHLPAALLTEQYGGATLNVQDRIIGFWDVARFTDGPNAGHVSEWKQYYGLVRIPEGQNATEFAFSSGSERDPEHGNFLDGIHLRAPGFLHITKNIRDTSDNDVTFVQPGSPLRVEPLRVEIAVENLGEVPVDNIVIYDQFHPYNAYFRFCNPDICPNVNCNTCPPAVTVQRHGRDRPLTSTPTINYPEVPNVARPDGHPDFDAPVLTVELPVGETLEPGERLTVRFDMWVREHVASSEATTRLYEFRNQAEVSYFDVATLGSTSYRGFSAANEARRDENRKWNASFIDPVSGRPPTVHINPVSLSKELTQLTPVNRCNCTACDCYECVDCNIELTPLNCCDCTACDCINCECCDCVGGIWGREGFNVELTVENTLDDDIETEGIITVVIPPGFTLTLDDYGPGLPEDGFEIRPPLNQPPEADGSRRIIIQNVALSESRNPGDPDPGPGVDVPWRLQYSFNLRYTGDEFGVIATSISADYRYIVEDDDYGLMNVILSFPQRVVYVPAIAPANQIVVENVPPVTSPSITLVPENWQDLRRQDGDYIVAIPPLGTFMLIDEDGHDAWVNSNNEPEITIRCDEHNIPIFIARLITSPTIPGARDLVITPLPGLQAGEHEIRYRINLQATRGDEPPVDLSSHPPHQGSTITIHVENSTDPPLGPRGATLEVFWCLDCADCLCDHCDCYDTNDINDTNNANGANGTTLADPVPPGHENGGDPNGTDGCTCGDICDDDCECTDCDDSCECIDCDISTSGGDGSGNDSASAPNGEVSEDAALSASSNSYDGAVGEVSENTTPSASSSPQDVNAGDILIVTGFALGGGYGISRVNRVKTLKRKLDARAVRKINEHNERRRMRER